MKEQVVLRPAFAWDCPHCGARDNFATAVEAELTDDERRVLEKMNGLDREGEEWKQMSEAGLEPGMGLVTTPNEVTCPKCGISCDVFIDPDSRPPPDFDPHQDLR